MKVINEKVKNVSVQTIDIINNNLIEVVSDVKNKLNCEMMKLMMALMTKGLMKVISMIS